MSALDELSASRYVSLTTFKKDGTGRPTPVWVLRDGDRLLVWSAADAWKVRRVRRDPRVLVAPCDVRGRVAGPPVEGTARVTSREEMPRVLRLLVAKYGFQARMTLLGGRLRRRFRSPLDTTVGIYITLA
ncbi:PPOX class F420-dependent oxidoreductase [Spirilliplanes yamanashiensis]|uniref:PPOX class F420-dependent oxidoreductase n=1 Tax=Spirilliplanes yamanashiensis TaxID=42233 RepID=A0A8J3Y6N6_9ACTN|nr:PPOX class F420-dependent oxidoreductase [Spirilliplanes yamanashiensis]MDP9815123.1 PPOX class probable F420-dependent enzyme [Spirilliplanes yamanashiensis]GIJ02778.1 PPOX class F420-dependent oxidoreductase [Spirilliplanes yamanashiensis]